MFDPTLRPNAPQELALQTRKGGAIKNWMNPAPPHAGLQLQIAQLKNDHKAIHRNVGPSAQYNCHGLTFAARRTAIDDPAQVQRIIDHDGYRKLALLTEAPETGDIAIYVEDGDIIHSGIVVANREGTPWILGKWGECHEVVHPVLNCPYKNATVAYYRLMA
jgi:hypothetical protein